MAAAVVEQDILPTNMFTTSSACATGKLNLKDRSAVLVISYVKKSYLEAKMKSFCCQMVKQIIQNHFVVFSMNAST